MTTTINYFQGCATVEDVKKRYRELAMQNHPDKGGDTATMQEINAQYLSTLEFLDGEKSRDKAGKEHTYHYRPDIEQAIINKLDELLRAGLEDVEIYVIGLWVWVFGSTYENREKLADAGLTFQRHRKAWSWKPYKGRSRRSRMGLDTIAARYGCRRVDYRDRQQSRDEEPAPAGGQMLLNI